MVEGRLKSVTLFRLQPNVEVGVYAHHECANRSSGLEQQDPCPVKEEEDTEKEFNSTARCFDVVHVVVQWLPQCAPECVHHE